MKTLTSLFGIVLLCPVVCSGADYGRPATTVDSPSPYFQYTPAPVYVMPRAGYVPPRPVLVQQPSPQTTVPPQTTRPTEPARDFVQTADLRRTIPSTNRVSQTEGTTASPVTLSRPATTSAMLDSRFDSGVVYR